ncbi:MAG TPA: S8 family serine peptidase [Thermoanaerobaculia bacterium]|jgi:subtilisin family serine protease
MKITINGITLDHESIASASAAPPRARGLRATANAQHAANDGQRHFLVHVTAPLTREQREQLTTLGVEMLERIAPHVLLVHCDDGKLPAVQALPFVEWAVPYAKEFKIHANLAETITRRGVALAAHAADETLHEVDVLLHKTATQDAISAIAAAAGMAVDQLQIAGGKVRLRATEMQIAQITRLHDVRHVEPVPKATLSNDVATRIIAADVVHAQLDRSGRPLDGSGQVVAIADTGFDLGSTTDLHPAFATRIARLYPLGRPDSASDPDGHGTHVAGSIAGSAVNGGAVRGSAPAARLVVQSLLDNVRELSGFPVHLGELFATPYESDGARVHNDSWTLKDTKGEYVAAARELDQFVWDHRDFVVCAAAGNTGRDSSFRGVVDEGSVQAPGTAKNCITVGACESERPTQAKTWAEGFPTRFAVPPIAGDSWANSAEGMAAFSSRGPTKDGRIKPDVVAPGTSILSAASRAVTDPDRFWGASDDPLYCYRGGTSMATPLVSGCAAIVRQYLIAEGGLATPSAALVKAMLINGAVPLQGQYTPSECGPRPSFGQGFGRVHLARTLGLVDGDTLALHDEAEALDGAGDEQRFTLAIPAGAKSIAVTLVWTDLPGERLVHDLDLIVRAGGQERHGNMPPDSKELDRVNNVEEVIWPAPPAGTAEVAVRAYDVSLAPQTFALVMRISV